MLLRNIFRLKTMACVLGVGAAFVAGVAAESYRPKLLQPDVRSTPRFLERVTQFEVIQASPSNVFLGDSLTERGLWNELLPGAEIANRGIGSITVPVVMEQLGRVPPSAKAAFVLAGVNDVAKGRDPGAIAQDYRVLVSELRTRGLAVHVVATLLTAKPAWNREIAKLNVELKAMCDGETCIFIDINDAIGSQGVIRPEFTSDGIHLTGAGYRLWADALKPYLHS